MGRNRSSAHTKAQRNGRERDYNRCQVCGFKKHVEGHHIIDHQFGGAAVTENKTIIGMSTGLREARL